MAVGEKHQHGEVKIDAPIASASAAAAAADDDDSNVNFIVLLPS